MVMHSTFLQFIWTCDIYNAIFSASVNLYTDNVIREEIKIIAELCEAEFSLSVIFNKDANVHTGKIVSGLNI